MRDIMRGRPGKAFSARSFCLRFRRCLEIRRNIFMRAAVIIALSALVMLSACSIPTDSNGGGDGAGYDTELNVRPDEAPKAEFPAGAQPKINVVTTFDAPFELALAIGGDRVSVSKIIPDGAEAHDFEPKAKDIIALSSADVFILSGFGFEPWAASAKAAADRDNLIVTELSRGIEPITVSNGRHDRSHDRDDESHDHDGPYDPHIWLSLTCAVIMAENVRDAFCEADPGGTEEYSRNFDIFTESLDVLFREYSEKFGALENKTIVTGHAVFAYLCRDFGLTQNSVEGVFAEGEPSARALAELVEYCREHNLTTILTEYLSGSSVAETLAGEVGAGVRDIYTMESAENGLTYLERMAENLAVIYESLPESAQPRHSLTSTLMPPTIETKTWQDAYAALLRGTSDKFFFLCDIDRNEIPELLIGGPQTETDKYADYDVYIFKNYVIKCIGTVGTLRLGYLWLDNNGGILGYAYGAGGGETYRYYIDNDVICHDGVVYGYYYDGDGNYTEWFRSPDGSEIIVTEETEDEYQRIRKSNIELECYDITESNITTVIYGA